MTALSDLRRILNDEQREFCYNETQEVKKMEAVSYTHLPRRDQNAPMKSILISTCGFTTIENNYEALIRQFDLAFGTSLKICLLYTSSVN